MQRLVKINRAYIVTPLFLFFGIMTSCDCMQQLQGHVVDAQTREPLSEVVYSRDRQLTADEKLLDKNDTMYHYLRRTDSTGGFLDFRLAHGLRCKPPLVLWFEKEGYEPLRVEWQRNKSNMDTLLVKLHRTEISSAK